MNKVIRRKKDYPPILKNVELKKLDKKYPEVYKELERWTLVFMQNIEPVDLLNIIKGHLFINDAISYETYKELNDDFALYCTHKFIVENPYINILRTDI